MRALGFLIQEINKDYEGEKEMKVSDIYFKTLKFSLIKLAIGLGMTLFTVLFLALCVTVGALFNADIGIPIGIMVWAFVTGGVYKLVMNYFGYMIKAAHVAIIATAVTTGEIPDDMVNVGMNMVKERFVTTNVYYVLDRLVSGAVSQLQRAVGKVGNLFDFIPGMDSLTNILQKFIRIALGYVDECCLGYTFVNKEQSPFKSACDGVCIYFQNIKELLKNAAKITLVVIITTFLAWILPFIIIGVVFRALGWSMFIGFILALTIAISVRKAFIDSYMLVKTMVAYMELAPSTVITFDLYDKLCKLSSKFKELFNKATQEVSI